MKQGDTMILPKSIAPTKNIDNNEHPDVGFEFDFGVSGSVSHLTESLKDRIMKEDKKDDKEFDSTNIKKRQSVDTANNSNSNSNNFTNKKNSMNNNDGSIDKPVNINNKNINNNNSNDNNNKIDDNSQIVNSHNNINDTNNISNNENKTKIDCEFQYEQ